MKSYHHFAVENATAMRPIASHRLARARRGGDFCTVRTLLPQSRGSVLTQEDELAGKMCICSGETLETGKTSLAGGGSSQLRTSLVRRFPANREKYRELARFWR